MPYERVRGKSPLVIGVEFGEKVLYHVARGSKLEKTRARWHPGIFVGVKRKSNQLMIATPEGIHFVRAVRRIPFEKRWG